MPEEAIWNLPRNWYLNKCWTGQRSDTSDVTKSSKQHKTKILEAEKHAELEIISKE